MNDKRLEQLKTDFFDAWSKLKIDEKLDEQAKLEDEVADPEIWKNPENAREKNERLARLKESTGDWQILKMQINDISELLELSDEGLESEIEAQIGAMEQNFSNL
mgnify:FL=1